MTGLVRGEVIVLLTMSGGVSVPFASCFADAVFFGRVFDLFSVGTMDLK